MSIVYLTDPPCAGIFLEQEKMPTAKDYEDGLHEGRLRGIEETVNKHDTRLDSHESRITSQERITYAILGAVALLNILPILKSIFGNA